MVTTVCLSVVLGCLGMTPDARVAVVDHAQVQDGLRATPVDIVSPAYRLAAPAPCRAGRDDLLLDLSFVGASSDPDGDGPTDIQHTPDGTRVVVACRDSQNLIVFDVDTRLAVATVALSGSPQEVAITPDGTRAVTANLHEDTASIVDLTTYTEIAVVPVGDQPGGVKITPDGTRAVVGNTVDESISVVDIATATELHRIDEAGFRLTTSFNIEAGLVIYSFTNFEIAADNRTVILPDRYGNQISFFDINQGTVHHVGSLEAPDSVAISADGRKAVVGHEGNGRAVSVIDVNFQSISKTIAAPDTLYNGVIALNPAATKCAISLLNDTRIIDIVDDIVGPIINTSYAPRDLGTTPDGQYLVCSNYATDVIDWDTESIVARPNYILYTLQASCSPTQNRMVGVQGLVDEDLVFVNADGGAAHLEGIVPSGPLPEGDAASWVAVTPAGDTAVLINAISDNAAIIDLATDTVRSYVPVGDRAGEVAITPDGTKAVCSVRDDSWCTVIDLATDTGTNIPISRRQARAHVSPDSHYAYVPTIASPEGVWRINLLTNQVEGAQLPTGNLSTVGYVFSQWSGSALSPDGHWLVTCNSYDDTLTIIDAPAWTVAATVNAGDVPARALFSDDSATLFVTSRDTDEVLIIDMSDPTGPQDAVAVGDMPYVMASHPARPNLYVANFNDRTISVVDTTRLLVTDTIALPQPDGAGQPVGLHVSDDGAYLYVAANGADFHVIDTATNAIIATVNTGLAPVHLAFHDGTRTGFMPSPLGDDGLSMVRVRFPGTGDFDGDGDVDLKDFASLSNCFTGAGGTAPVGCAEGDFDLDQDVDADDFAEFVVAFD